MLQLNQMAASDVSDVSRIYAQVDSIFRDPRFSTSGILKKFLKFIVTETLHGRGHLLKEYTIGLEVLQKPVTFNPQENCIVRVHAARLRRILSDYYTGPGATDEVQIMLPKGHYIPVFCENRKAYIPENKVVLDKYAPQSDNEPSMHTIAVVPFHYSGLDGTVASVADGLGLSLSTELMKLRPPVKVISYNVMRLMGSTYKDFRRWEISMQPRYVFLGNIQQHKDSIRVTIQLVRTSTYEQLWCHVYEHHFTPDNAFMVQDDIATHVVKSVRRLGLLSGIRTKKHAIVAVA